jgi:DNA-binding beta-propeller fold protein YncE
MPLLWVAVSFILFQETNETSGLYLAKTVELTGKPGKLDHFAFDSASDRLFVSNQGNSSLDVIDVKAGKLLKQIPGQKRIHGMAIDPKSGRIFVANGEPGECAIIDGRTYEVLKRAAASFWVFLPMPPAGPLVF